MKKEVFFDEFGEGEPSILYFPCYYKSIEQYDDGREVTYYAFHDADKAEILTVTIDEHNGELSFAHGEDSDGPTEYGMEFFRKETKIKGYEFNKMMNLYKTVINKIKEA